MNRARFIRNAFFCSVLVLSPCAFASSTTDSLEIPLTKAFVAPVGFDDNDTVQIVLSGYLPNACYRLDHTEVVRDEAKRPLSVKQFAIVIRDGVCAEQDNLPAQMSEVVPFMSEVNVGRLSPGTYNVSYLRSEGAGVVRIDNRVFAVTQAVSPSVDNIRYASMSGVHVRDVVSITDRVEALISGVLTSSCTELAPRVSVTKIDDVVIVLPGLSFRENPLCAFVLRPFERTVDITSDVGQFTAGSYLIHVRSSSGQAVNRVFHVETAAARPGR